MGSIQDAGKEAIDKGSAAFSDFAGLAGDLAAKAKIRMQLLDQGLEYDSLMKRLGEAVYEEVKLDERYTNAHAELFEQIAEVVERKHALEDEYARVASESVQAEQPEGDKE